MAEPESHYRHCMLFEYRRGVSATEATNNILKAYGPVVSVFTCQRWFDKFKSGVYDLENKPKSGRPRSLNDDDLKTLVTSDPRLITNEMADRLGCDQATVWRRLKQLGMVSKAGF